MAGTHVRNSKADRLKRRELKSLQQLDEQAKSNRKPKPYPSSRTRKTGMASNLISHRHRQKIRKRDKGRALETTGRKKRDIKTVP